MSKDTPFQESMSNALEAYQTIVDSLKHAFNISKNSITDYAYREHQQNLEQLQEISNEYNALDSKKNSWITGNLLKKQLERLQKECAEKAAISLIDTAGKLEETHQTLEALHTNMAQTTSEKDKELAAIREGWLVVDKDSPKMKELLQHAAEIIGNHGPDGKSTSPFRK